jgi:hypothetical protein
LITPAQSPHISTGLPHDEASVIKEKFGRIIKERKKDLNKERAT